MLPMLKYIMISSMLWWLSLLASYLPSTCAAFAAESPSILFTLADSG